MNTKHTTGCLLWLIPLWIYFIGQNPAAAGDYITTVSTDPLDGAPMGICEGDVDAVAIINVTCDSSVWNNSNSGTISHTPGEKGSKSTTIPVPLMVDGKEFGQNVTVSVNFEDICESCSAGSCNVNNGCVYALLSLGQSTIVSSPYQSRQERRQSIVVMNRTSSSGGVQYRLPQISSILSSSLNNHDTRQCFRAPCTGPSADNTPKRPAGYIKVYAPDPNISLGSPASLQLVGIAPDVDVIRSGNPLTGPLRQVMAEECLADIVSNKNYQFEVRFYHTNDVGSLDTNGLYTINSGSEPFSVYRLEIPDEGTATNIYLITKTQTGTTSLYEYVASGDGLLTLNSGSPDGYIKGEGKLITSNATSRTEVSTVEDGNSVVASKTSKKFELFPWGEELTESVTDPDGAALTTRHTYCDDEEATGKYGYRTFEEQAGGNWTRYDYDESSRLISEVTPWENSPTNAADDEAKAVYYSYASVYPYIVITNTWSTNIVSTNFYVTNGVTNEVVSTNDMTMTNIVTNAMDTCFVEPSAPRTITTKSLGQVVGKVYQVYYLNEMGDRVEITETCADPEAAYGAESNLRMEKIINHPSYAAGSNRVQRITFADGTRDDYIYEYGTWQTNGTFTASETGTYTRVTCTHCTMTASNGVAGKSTRQVGIEDSVGRVVMREAYIYTGNGYERMSWTINSLDDMGHVTETWSSNGVHTEATWGCCGKEWEKDENGVEYSYTYDALKRLTQKVKHGLSQGAYPAQDDIYTTYTYDAEGRQLTATVTAGGLSLVSSNTYDLAGRITKSTDSAGLVTEYVYADGGRTVTETLPGGTTRITERYVDGQVKSFTGTAQVPQYYAYGVNENGTKYTTIYSASNNSPVWVKTTTDLLGRTAKVEKPGYLTTEATEYFYNSKGQLVKTTTSGQADTLYAYDEIGNQIRSGLDIDDNGELDIAGTDRITEQDTASVQIGNDWFLQTENKLYATDNSATPTTNSVTRQRLTGFTGTLISDLRSLDHLGNETVTTVTVDPDNKLVTQTTDVPNSSSNLVTVAVNGLTQSQTSKSGLTTTFAYDALGRRTGATDPRLGTATTHYDSHGWVDYVDDAAGNRTTFSYDSATGRRISQTDPLTNVTYYSYTDHGQLEKTWGSATYPVSYEYDGYGRMIKMNTYRGGSGWTGSTWPASPGTADTTEWIYHEASGLLTSKKDAAGKAVAYTYSSGGKLATRTWSRTNGTNSLITSYTYNDASDLSDIDYSDSTPDVSFTYDRLGRQKTAESSVSSHTFAYQILNLQSEIVVRDGVTNTITRNYDSLGRSTGFDLSDASSAVQYGYDSLGRFSSVSSSVETVSSVVNYSYLPNSDLLSGYSDSASGLQVTRTYEQNRNLLTQVNNQVDSETLSQFDYINDAGGRRTSVKHSGTAFETGAAFNLYTYNSRSEVLVGDRYWGANLNDTDNPVDGQGFAYAYDNIGNRTAASRDNEETTYTANNLNQYSQRTIADLIDILGSAETGTTVTVNNLATTRHGKYWHLGLGVTNNSSSVYQSVNVVGVYNPPGTNDPDVVTTETGHVFVAKTPETFSYDDDGNLIADGRFNYTWDSENRLISAEILTNLPTSVPRVKVEFAYDYMSRRVVKTVSSWNSSSNAWDTIETRQNVFSGWDLIREKVANVSETKTNWYVHGLDLSGSLSGAGGIGGLLSATLGTNSVVYSYDGNGNVSELLAVDSGSLKAHYEYSPLGETIVATGPLAKDNPFRFSTKFTDDDMGLVYYGYRYYSPMLGRWLSRDPIGERNIAQLYNMVHNNLITFLDYMGITQISPNDLALIALDLGRDNTWHGGYEIKNNPATRVPMEIPDSLCSTCVRYSCTVSQFYYAEITHSDYTTPDISPYLPNTDDLGADLLVSVRNRVERHEQGHGTVLSKFVGGARKTFTSTKSSCASARQACDLASKDVDDQEKKWSKDQYVIFNNSEKEWDKVTDAHRFDDVDTMVQNYLIDADVF